MSGIRYGPDNIFLGLSVTGLKVSAQQSPARKSWVISESQHRPYMVQCHVLLTARCLSWSAQLCGRVSDIANGKHIVCRHGTQCLAAPIRLHWPNIEVPQCQVAGSRRMM